MRSSIDLVTMPPRQPINIVTIGDDEEAYIAPHRHDYFEIIWSLGDEGTHSIDFVEYPIQSSRLYMVSPGQVHESTNLGDKVRLITFRPGFIENSYRDRKVMEELFFNHQTREPFIDIDAAGQQNLKKLFDIMICEKRRQEPDWDFLAALLKSFLRCLVRYSASGERKSNARDERVSRLLELIGLHFRQHRKTEYYAEQLSLTGKRMNELTRQHLGKTVTALIHDRIILEAHRELAFTTKNIKTIAMESGYDDPAYFCRFFRKMTNESPVEFRKRVCR